MIDATTPYQHQIKELFGKKSKTQTEQIFRLVELMLYQQMRSTDSFELYNILGLENFSKVINLLDGRSIRLPDKTELEETLTAALMYYERTFNNLSWMEIKQKYPELKISSLKYSVRIKNLENFTKQQIQTMLQET